MANSRCLSVTVRAFSAEKRFMDNMHEMIDATSKCYYIYWLTNRWLQWCISTLGGLAVLITMIFSISSLNAGIAGLCITSALSFTDALYWAVSYGSCSSLPIAKRTFSAVIGRLSSWT